MDLSRVHWLAVYWTLVSLWGLGYSARNFWLARRDWQQVQEAGAREAVIITAFTPVRTHAIMLVKHGIFIVLGIVGVIAPTPPGQSVFPSTLYGWVLTLIALAIPHLLIVMSYTISRDRGRVTRSLTAGN